MFGENAILGQDEVSIDEKHRIILPASTRREKGEKLILLFDKEVEKYKIYSIKKATEEFEMINSRIKEAKTKDEATEYKKRLYEYSKSILKCSNVDAQGRILLTDTFKKSTKVNCIGAYDHLILELKK